MESCKRMVTVDMRTSPVRHMHSAGSMPAADRQQERLRFEEDKLETLFVWLKTIQSELYHRA